MDKLNFSITKNGKELDKTLYEWDEKTRTFSTLENGLVLDFGTGSGCTFKTSFNCTFNTRSYCTFKTGSNCTFDTGSDCVIVRRDTYQIIEISDESITLCPHAVRGYIKNGVYSETGKPSIIADGILSEIISKKERKGITIYKVINYKETKQTYLIESDGTFSHGRTIKEAKESFKYKISNRDTSQYDSLTIDSILTIEESIKLYRTITGACEYGTRYFVENLSNPPKKLTIKKLIKITEGQFNYSMLVEYFNNKQQQT